MKWISEYNDTLTQSAPAYTITINQKVDHQVEYCIGITIPEQHRIPKITKLA